MVTVFKAAKNESSLFKGVMRMRLLPAHLSHEHYLTPWNDKHRTYCNMYRYRHNIYIIYIYVCVCYCVHIISYLCTMHRCRLGCSDIQLGPPNPTYTQPPRCVFARNAYFYTSSREITRKPTTRLQGNLRNVYRFSLIFRWVFPSGLFTARLKVQRGP